MALPVFDDNWFQQGPAEKIRRFMAAGTTLDELRSVASDSDIAWMLTPVSQGGGGFVAAQPPAPEPIPEPPSTQGLLDSAYYNPEPEPEPLLYSYEPPPPVYEPPPPVYEPPVQELPPVEPATATVAETQPVVKTVAQETKSASAPAAAPQSEILRPFGAYNWDRFGSLASKQALVQNMRNDGYSVQQIRDEISRLEPDRSALTERNFELLGLAEPVVAQPAATTQTGLLDTATTVAQPVTASTAATAQTGLLDTTAQSAQPTLDRGATVRTQQDSTASVQPSTILRPFGQYEWDRTASLADKQALVQRMINDGFTPTQVRNEITRLEPDRSALTESNFELLGLPKPVAAVPATPATIDRGTTIRTQQDSTGSVVPAATPAATPAASTAPQSSTILNPFGQYTWDRAGSLQSKQQLVQQMLFDGFTPQQIRNEIARLDPTPVTETQYGLLGLTLPASPPTVTPATQPQQSQQPQPSRTVQIFGLDWNRDASLETKRGYVQQLLASGYSPAQIRSEIVRLDPTPVEATSFEQLGIPIPTTGRSATERTGATRLESGEMQYNIAPISQYQQRSALAPVGLLNYGFGPEQGLFTDVPTRPETLQTQQSNLAAMQAAAPTATAVRGLLDRGLLTNQAPTAGVLAANQALMNQARQVSTGTALDKAAFYNNLRSQGMGDQQIQNIVGSSIGYQTPQDWNYLRQLGQTVQMAPQLQQRTMEGKASYFNDLLNSGLNYDQALSVINTGVGQQSNQDLLELARLASAQRAQPTAMINTAPGAFSQGLLAGGFPSVAGQTLLGFGA